MTPDELRAFRYRYNLPQAELADALGVSRTRIIDLEKGRGEPGRLLLLALAAYVEGLQPYQGDPGDLRAFAASQPRRINRPAAEPALRLVAR